MTIQGTTHGLRRGTAPHVAAVGCAAFASLAACSSSSGGGPSSSTSSSAASTAALDCAPAPAVAASPSCNDAPNSCASTTAAACTAQPCNAGSSCLAFADNGGKTILDLRMRKLHIAAPSTLAVTFVQSTLVDQNVNMNSACCEGGDGGFNVLIRLDTVAKTFTLGGGPPSADPMGAGYCFVNLVSEGLTVAPVTAAASLAADGTWQSAQFGQVFNMPIFAHGDTSNLLILPVSATRLEGVDLTTNGNCIGTYSEISTCQRWATAATLSGYITLENADRVLIPDLQGASLCTLLAPASVTGNNCTRDSNGAIVAKGNYCSLTDSPATATCADSVWLSATFAASAVPINSGAGVAQCQGAADAAPE